MYLTFSKVVPKVQHIWTLSLYGYKNTFLNLHLKMDFKWNYIFTFQVVLTLAYLKKPVQLNLNDDKI